MFKNIWTSSQLSSGAENLPSFPLGTIKGCSVRIDNQSNYGVQLLDSQGTRIDYIRPYAYVVMPIENSMELSVKIDGSTVGTITQPYQDVSYRLIKGVVAYQTGSLWQQNGATTIQNASIAVTGNVNATIVNATLQVAGSVNATIQNASLPITGNVGITSGTVDANITNATITINGNQTNSTGTLFADALTEYTGSMVPTPWTLQNGGFSFGASGATCTAPGSSITTGNGLWRPEIASDGTSKLPITVQATFQQSSNVNTTLVLWLPTAKTGTWDTQDNYLCYVDGNDFYLRKRVNGVTTVLKTIAQTLTASTSYYITLSLDTDGNLTAKLYQGTDTNGTLLQSITANDKSLSSGFYDGIGGDTGVIISNAKVTGPIKTVAVAGDVNITNATLPISGNVGITSGTVNAIIQNAQLDSNIVNASVATNTLVNLGQTSITLPAINAGSSTTENINVSGENVFDNIILLIKSANLTTYDGQGTAKSPIEVLFQQAYFTPDGTIYYPIFVNGSGGGNFDAQVEVMGQNPSNGYTSLRVKIPNAIPVSQIQLMFKNVYTSATAQDTLTVHMFGQLGNDTQLQNDYSPITYEIYNSTLTNSVASGSNFGGYVCPASNFVYVSFMCTWAQSVSSGMTVTLTETDSFTGLKVATSITPTYANNSGLYGLYVKKTALNFGDEISFSVSNNSGVTLTGVKQRILGWKQ